MIEIRPYRPEERPAIRRIVFATGFLGEPADWYWRDAESFAEIWSGYYTDREPESAFVAVEHDEVLGYLLGCADSRQAPSPRAAIARQVWRRQLPLRPGTAGFVWRALADVLREPSAPSGDLADPRFPSHLHIDLLPAARGRGAGRALMEAWLARLRSLGSPGCHLGTFAENTAAIRFFERMGFARHGPPMRVPGMRTRAGARMHQQLLVREVGPAPGAPGTRGDGGAW
jgi:ribosomal protein S18 acetylase RimI-like enzyme